MRTFRKVHLYYLIPVFICSFLLLGVIGILGNEKFDTVPIFHKSKAATISSNSLESSVVHKLLNNETVTIVVYGDSITWGYKRDTKSGKVKQVKNPYPNVLEEKLRKRFSNRHITVINNGHPGWTSIQALEHVKEEVLSYKPDMLITMFGINDARGHKKYSPSAQPVPIDLYKDNMQQLLQISKQNGIEVVILSPTTVTSKKNYANRTQINYTNTIKNLAQEENIRFVNGSDIQTEGNLSDGVHFKADKYGLIADKIMLDIFTTE
ncbi:SGNH/GDSL hydrolase family protein [Ferdinandcohnia sp. Marseille-Q9671]